MKESDFYFCVGFDAINDLNYVVITDKVLYDSEGRVDDGEKSYEIAPSYLDVLAESVFEWEPPRTASSVRADLLSRGFIENKKLGERN